MESHCSIILVGFAMPEKVFSLSVRLWRKNFKFEISSCLETAILESFIVQVIFFPLGGLQILSVEK